MDPNATNSWGWLALALVNAGLAEQKNRSRLSWFLLSLLLGPIATLYIVATAAPQSEPVPPTPITLPTVLLAGGIVLTIISAMLGYTAFFVDVWPLWVATGLSIALALTAFILFIARDRAARVEDRTPVVSREAASGE